MTTWRNKRKLTEPSTGVIAGKTVTSKAVGRYTNLQLLRRVTMANILFESAYYQTSDVIMTQIENLVKLVRAEDIVDLAVEIRERHGLRHTPLWLLCLAHEQKGDIREAISKICTRPDMILDMCKMYMFRNPKKTKLRIPKAFKKGFADCLENYSEFQLARYKKSNHEISLVDIANLIHPKATPAISALMKGELKSEALENQLSAGGDMKKVFTQLIEDGKMGSMQVLRNMANFEKCGLERNLVLKAIESIKSGWITPLDFLKAYKYGKAYLGPLARAMDRHYSQREKIKGSTILVLDVSGSMGAQLSAKSEFKRIDLALSLAAMASSVFEDLQLYVTAGNDGSKKHSTQQWNETLGLNLVEELPKMNSAVGSGGIFTFQVCEYLKDIGAAKNADRLVVISDSADIGVSSGERRLPDTKPYKTSYIIDISVHTHGIKTGNWTAEINGVSEKLFDYILEIEREDNN